MTSSSGTLASSRGHAFLREHSLTWRCSGPPWGMCNVTWAMKSSEEYLRVLAPDAGPTLDGETRVFPAERLAGDIGIYQALLEKPGDHPAAPDLAENLTGPQGDVEEAAGKTQRCVPPAASLKKPMRMSKSSLPMSAKSSRS
jgi:hypothetical protein